MELDRWELDRAVVAVAWEEEVGVDRVVAVGGKGVLLLGLVVNAFAQSVARRLRMSEAFPVIMPNVPNVELR